MRQFPETGPYESSLADFAAVGRLTTAIRVAKYEEWRAAREQAGVWPYARVLLQAPAATTTIEDSAGRPTAGLNFASQDYLGLAAHPGVHDAVIEALREFGPHSAGSAVLLGNTSLSRRLQQELAEFVGCAHAVLYPTGWAAGFGVIAALTGPDDHVVLDSRAHACLQQGARAATPSVHHFRHLDHAHARERLTTIRQTDAHGSILVVTEGLFSMDADIPDVGALQQICREFDARLIVDVAHDLGSMGPGGTGTLGTQQLLGRVDLVMGSFSKTFASNGGFVATSNFALSEYLKGYSNPHLFSNALSPLQAAVVQRCLQIVRSGEGAVLRDRAAAIATVLRDSLLAQELKVLGVRSPIVPVEVGSSALARAVSRRIAALGLLANLVEYPAVPRYRARFRLQVMAAHTQEHARTAATTMRQALDGARADSAAAEPVASGPPA